MAFQITAAEKKLILARRKSVAAGPSEIFNIMVMVMDKCDEMDKELRKHQRNKALAHFRTKVARLKEEAEDVIEAAELYAD